MDKDNLILACIESSINSTKNIIVSGYIASLLKHSKLFRPPSLTDIEDKDFYQEKFGIHIFGYLNNCIIYINQFKSPSDLSINTLKDEKMCYYTMIDTNIYFIQTRDIVKFGPILKPLSKDFTSIFYETVLEWCGVIPRDDYKEGRYWEVWLIYLNGKPIGICGLYTLKESKDLDELWLGWLGIIPEYRNLKLGGEIMTHLYSEARKVGAKKIYSYVGEDGKPLNFYKREGFKVIGNVGEYLKDRGIDYIDGDDFESLNDYVIMKELS